MLRGQLKFCASGLSEAESQLILSHIISAIPRGFNSDVASEVLPSGLFLYISYLVKFLIMYELILSVSNPNAPYRVHLLQSLIKPINCGG